MNGQTIKLAVGAVAAVGVAIGGYYAYRKYSGVIQKRIEYWLDKDRHLIRDRVIKWLHQNNLEKSALTGLVYKCDTFAGNLNKILCQVYAETKEIGKVKISEEIISIDELQDVAPDVAKQLIANISKAETSIMSQIM